MVVEFVCAEKLCKYNEMLNWGGRDGRFSH